MKQNYDNLMEEIIKKTPKHTKLLLHCCCGPCSSSALNRLSKHFDITCLYYNPNIYPKEEYEKRLTNQKKVLKIYNDIPLVALPYNEEEFLSKVKGLEDIEEGGKRCIICFYIRLLKTALYAKEHDFKYFTTSLTLGPQKNSMILNNLGSCLAKKYNLSYLYSDFKKKDGYLKSIIFSKENDIYRQNYCGCRYSKKETEKL